MVNVFKGLFSRIKKAGEFWSYGSYFESEWISPHSPFLTSAGLYLLYRLIIWLFIITNFMTHIIIGTFMLERSIIVTFSFLTIQSMAIVNIYFTLELILALVYFINKNKIRSNFYLRSKEAPSRVPLWVRAKGALGNVAIVSAFTVTLLYWSLLYSFDGQGPTYTNIFIHGLNSVVCLIDLFVIERGISIYQVYQPIIFTLWYILFSLFYHLAGGKNHDGDPYIYPILDWRKPGVALTVALIGAVAVTINHCLVFLFYKLRRYIRIVLLGNSKTKEESEFTSKNPVQTTNYEDKLRY
uniref:Rolling stone n=1 Tax=Caligus rogercresseyi TaxID=217165 RepID=C1BNB4_CALRO|nr:rolling stone [Caligus rogercresseyi]